jgi:hypothetical protein
MKGSVLVRFFCLLVWCLPTCMMSVYLYDSFLPVWCLLNCTVWCLPTCMMSPLLYDVCLPAYFFSCLYDICCLPSAQLHDVCSTIWYLPILYDVYYTDVMEIEPTLVRSLINSAKQKVWYLGQQNFVSTCARYKQVQRKKPQVATNFRNEVVLIYTKGNFWEVYWFMSKKLTAP